MCARGGDPNHKDAVFGFLDKIFEMVLNENGIKPELRSSIEVMHNEINFYDRAAQEISEAMKSILRLSFIRKIETITQTISNPSETIR